MHATIKIRAQHGPEAVLRVYVTLDAIVEFLVDNPADMLLVEWGKLGRGWGLKLGPD